MSETTSLACVNSRQWWDDYFVHHWERNNGRRQTAHFAERLVASLPAAEVAHLSSQAATVLDWGCACGDGVEILAKAFPRCRVVGLDYSREAIAKARQAFPQHEFQPSESGEISSVFDVVITSNCLEHFAAPLDIIQKHLRSCRAFYVLLVPYREAPLCESHLSQFREECFPECLQGFTRIATKVIDVDPAFWNGQQLLVIYASPAYLRRRAVVVSHDEEREKWDSLYSSLPVQPLDTSAQKFGEELAEKIEELLPAGGSVLEAGCGGGSQSMILAERNKLRVTLMDFAPAAVQFAQQAFAQRGLSATFLCEDVFAPGREEHDLVFNAGVLEHYTFDEQVAFLRSMTSRSRKYVLALVPNRHCYWYWIWRLQATANGAWPFGKEVPVGDLSAAFEAAGLTFLGECFGGGAWSEDFISHLPGLDDKLRECVLAVHRSGVIPAHEQGYLLAALGCKGEAPSVPSCWRKTAPKEVFSGNEQTAALADALGLAIAGGYRQTQFQRRIAELEDTERQLNESRAAAERQLDESRAAAAGCNAQLDAMVRSRAWALVLALRAVRLRLLPRGSCRESAARLAWRTACGLRTPRATLRDLARPVFRRLPLRVQYRLKAAVGALHGWRLGSGRAASHRAEPTEVRGLVSVVLPVYNHATYLRGAIDSVLAQTYDQLELIVVNDGSRDGAEKVLADYVDHPRVRILTQVNQQLPKALSNGFEFARGEFWTWTSADNLMHPDQLRRQVEFLRAHSDAGMVFADYTAIDDEGQPLTDAAFRPHNRRTAHDPNIHLPHDTRSFGKNGDNFIGPCFLYRSWIGRLLGEYDPIQGIEDFDYWLRLSLVGRIAHLDSDEPLYQYRVHANSLSGRAEELNISQHARQLMDYHQAREDFHAKPWTIHGDAATLAWLNKIDTSPHRVIPWSGQRLTDQSEEKCLLLVRADSLPATASSRSSRAVPLVAWFPANAHATDPCWTTVAGSADLCFAADDGTAARLALLTRQVFCVAPGPSLLALATNWANGQTFYQATRPPARRVRALPRVFQAEGNTTRVLLQADGFTQGGMEQVILDLARCLQSDGFEASLLVLGTQGQDVARARRIGIPVLCLPKGDRETEYRRLLKDRRINLVNAHYSLFGAPIAAEQGVPFVQTVHGTYVCLPPQQVAAYQAADRFTSAYVCVSQMAAHYSDVKLGLPVSKMVVVPNGIDIARLDAAAGPGSRKALRRELGLAAEDFVFLNVGSIYSIKCQATLVNAFTEVAQAFPRARLLLVGRAMDPAYWSQVKRAIARHHLEDAVCLTEHRDDVARFFSAADAFVLPSLCEGWSLALAEAIVSGLPIVATAVGSAPELLPQFGGRLIRPPFGAITNLDSQKLDKYAATEDPRFVQELATAMRETCQVPSRPLVPDALRRTFDCRHAYQPYGQLFRWLLQGGHPSATRPWTDGRLASSQLLSPADMAAA